MGANNLIADLIVRSENLNFLDFSLHMLEKNTASLTLLM